MLYNMMFTATPILVYGIEEQDLPKNILETDPSIYRLISRNQNMRPSKFVSWFLNGVFHGVTIFCIFYVLWSNTIFSSGQSLGLFAFGLILYHGVVITSNLKLAIMTRYWSIYFVSCLILSFASLIGFMTLYSNFKWNILNDDLFGIYHEFLISPSFWLSFLLCPFVTLLPDVLILVLRNSLRDIFTTNRIRSM